MKLEDCIPYGKENAISRKELQRLTGWPDRIIRSEIKRINKGLAKNGEAILSSSGGRGYWRTSDIEEMKRYLKESEHRRAETAKHDMPILEIVCRAENMVLIPVRAHMRRVRRKEGQQHA